MSGKQDSQRSLEVTEKLGELQVSPSNSPTSASNAQIAANTMQTASSNTQNTPATKPFNFANVPRTAIRKPIDYANLPILCFCGETFEHYQAYDVVKSITRTAAMKRSMVAMLHPRTSHAISAQTSSSPRHSSSYNTIRRSTTPMGTQRQGL